MSKAPFLPPLGDLGLHTGAQPPPPEHLPGIVITGFDEDPALVSRLTELLESTGLDVTILTLDHVSEKLGMPDDEGRRAVLRAMDALTMQLPPRLNRRYLWRPHPTPSETLEPSLAHAEEAAPIVLSGQAIASALRTGLLVVPGLPEPVSDFLDQVHIVYQRPGSAAT